ncbi:MAG TPA: type II toxin-antitoxin system VapB family antitoxin [Pirellulales bacterium]|jgi:Arc/MetJ family transcription regulator|nr:type II toxin-antitoxin system VapB family antitoxin [Pirellulales bacterium]
MPTNLGIDEKLLSEALRLGGHRTKKATVNEALAEYIAQRKRVQGLRLLGTIAFDSGSNKPATRKKRR